MARSDINKVVQDLNSDDGSVLWSFIMGEQLEYPITLNFLTNAYGYTYEAVIVEADNLLGIEGIPETIKAGGVITTVTIRIPPERGDWSPVVPYSREDVVLYLGVYYKLKTGVSYQSATSPADDTTMWEVYVPNKIHIQFPSTLGSTWSVKPTASIPVYGFVEIRVTEPPGGIYQRTWKPIRGLIELGFSPTELV
jgi:hypothetical protein